MLQYASKFRTLQKWNHLKNGLFSAWYSNGWTNQIISPTNMERIIAYLGISDPGFEQFPKPVQLCSVF